MFSTLCKWILTTLGWEIHGVVPDTRKYIIIAAPHTSNWDFPLGIMAIKALKMDVRWIGKHTIFRWPFGWFFRALGGTPVDRAKSRDLIPQLTRLFDQSEALIFALAPEGTRRKTDHWKSGFYQLARAANVPIALGYLDFGRKRVGFSHSFHPGSDIKEDFKLIRDYYKDKQGKNPENASLIRLKNQD